MSEKPDQLWEVARQFWQFWNRDQMPAVRVPVEGQTPSLRPEGSIEVGTSPIFRTVTFNRHFQGGYVVVTSPDFPGWSKAYHVQ